MPDMQAGQKIFLNTSFEIVRLLGEGAFGKVFLIKKNFLNGLLPRHYAFKLFHSSASADVLKAEAEAMFKLRSPHCAVVHSVEELGDGRGLIMEYIEGVSLDELGRTYPLTSNEGRYIVQQCGLGLEDLFKHGQLHGDLSPRNIMIDKAGRVVLVDFGLSQVLPSEVMGNPAYLSPSRTGGRPSTPEDDLFALKLIAFDISNRLIGKTAPLWFWEERKQKALVAGQTPVLEKSVPLPQSLLRKIEMILHMKAQKKDTLISSAAIIKLHFTRARVFSFLLLGILLSTSPASSRWVAQARFSLRSLHWIEVRFPEGTVVRSRDQEVQLPAGIYSVRWQTSRKTGIKTIELKENQSLTLSDLDFD